MKLPIAEFIHDSFIDFEGKEHHFVICALSQVLPTNMETYKNSIYTIQDWSDGYDLREVNWEINTYIEDYGQEFYQSIVKGLSIGIAICNPDDEFNFEIGKKIALEKAKKSLPCIYVTELGYINTTMVQGFLRQEAEYLKDNPGKYITGYKDKQKKFLENESIKALEHTLSEDEKRIAHDLVNIPGYLDKLLKYGQNKS